LAMIILRQRDGLRVREAAGASRGSELFRPDRRRFHAAPDLAADGKLSASLCHCLRHSLHAKEFAP
ncbi:MAG: hypothetical protein ACTHNH_07700, partial [Mesorhizobium sp.]